VVLGFGGDGGVAREEEALGGSPWLRRERRTTMGLRRLPPGPLRRRGAEGGGELGCLAVEGCEDGVVAADVLLAEVLVVGEPSVWWRRHLSARMGGDSSRSFRGKAAVGTSSTGNGGTRGVRAVIKGSCFFNFQKRRQVLRRGPVARTGRVVIFFLFCFLQHFLRNESVNFFDFFKSHKFDWHNL
jgi:hypothetical protein